MNDINRNPSYKPTANVCRPPVVNGITIVDVSPPSTILPTVVEGSNGKCPHVIPREPCNLLPRLVSQHQAAEDVVAKLQKEQQELQSRLRHLRHHLSLRKLHARYASNAKETNHRPDSSYEKSRLLSERRKALVASHSASVRGPYAREYQTLLTEYIRLEDRYRHVTASRIVARYRLQQLIIDTICPSNKTTSVMVSLSKNGPSALSVGRPDASFVNTLHSVCSPSPTHVQSCGNSPRMNTIASKDSATQVVNTLLTCASSGAVKQTGDVPHPKPPSEAAVSSRKSPPQPLGGSAGVTSTISPHLPDIMSYVLAILPPPDLSYPSNESGPDRRTLTYETSYMRTRLEADQSIKPLLSDEELTAFLVIASRLIPESGGRRVCAVCGGVVKVSTVVRLDDLQALAEHLQQVHPRSPVQPTGCP